MRKDLRCFEVHRLPSSSFTLLFYDVKRNSRALLTAHMLLEVLSLSLSLPFSRDALLTARYVYYAYTWNSPENFA